MALTSHSLVLPPMAARQNSMPSSLPSLSPYHSPHSFPSPSPSLSSPPPTPSTPPPLPPPPASAASQLRQVAIVGAGIAGLSTALSLVRTARVPASHIDVFEPREGLDHGQGAGLNLNSGAAILTKEYGVNLRRKGVPAVRAYSTLSSTATMFDIDISTRFKHTYLDGSDGNGTSVDGSAVHVVTMLREDLQNELYAAVLKLGVYVRRGRQYAVRSVTEDRRLVFRDGAVSPMAYDLVIGADGVRSTVRDVVLDDGEAKKKAKRAWNGKGKGKRARFTGVQVAWLIAPNGDDRKLGCGIHRHGDSYSDTEASHSKTGRDSGEADDGHGHQHHQQEWDTGIHRGEMRQIICNGGTVVSYAVSSEMDMFAFLYRGERNGSGKDNVQNSRIRENVAYRTSTAQRGKGKKKKKKSDDVEREKKRERERVRQVKVVAEMRRAGVPPAVIARFENPGPGARFIESGVYDHGVLPTWHRNGVVLVGDAAHAMAPFMGQGANQTIQDAHVLALKLREEGSVEDALASYERVFKKEVRSIAKKSRMLGYVLTKGGVVGTLLRMTLQKVSKTTGILEREMVQAFQPRYL